MQQPQILEQCSNYPAKTMLQFIAKAIKINLNSHEGAEWIYWSQHAS